jgi:hypothetical protein
MPELHPLARALGHDWQWLPVRERQVTCVLHPCGLHFYVGLPMLWGPAWRDSPVWGALAAACRAAVRNGATGRHQVTVTDGSSVLLEPYPLPPLEEER